MSVNAPRAASAARDRSHSIRVVRGQPREPDASVTDRVRVSRSQLFCSGVNTVFRPYTLYTQLGALGAARDARLDA
eukprot:2715746-Prymnesium_polylepis.1